MCHELRTAPAQPVSHKAWHQAGRPCWDHHSSGALAFHPSLNAADAPNQPCILPRIQPIQTTGSSSRAPGAARRFPGSSPRGRAVGTLCSAAGPSFRTLPSILRPGFRSLSAPNNAALAEHLPRAAPAPADGLAGASCHCPERLRARGQKAAAGSPEESQRSPQCPIKQPAPSATAGRRGMGRHTGHDGVKKGNEPL